MLTACLLACVLGQGDGIGVSIVAPENGSVRAVGTGSARPGASAGGVGSGGNVPERAVREPERDRQPGLPPPVSKNGLTLTLGSISMQSQMMFDHANGKIRNTRSVTVQGSVTTEPGMIVMQQAPIVLTKLTDVSGKDLLTGTTQHALDMRPTRERLIEEAVSNSGRRREPRTIHAVGSARRIVHAGTGVGTIEGYALVHRVGGIARETIQLKSMAEALEVTPGLTFLLTKVETSENTVRLGFEVRTRRNKEGDASAPGEEPVFLGLHARDAEGNSVQTWQHGQRLELRDEWVLVMTDAVIMQDMMGKVKTWEVEVATGLSVDKLEFSLPSVEGIGAEMVDEE